MANILQSNAWAGFQRNLGHKVFQASGDGWRYLAILEGGRTGRYLYCPYGPEARTPQAFEAALDDLARTARSERCWFVHGVGLRSTATSGGSASAATTSSMRAVKRRQNCSSST